MEPGWAERTFTHKADVTAVEIPTLASMSDGEYRGYARDGLLYTDHNWILRSTPADYPIAVNVRQLDILIDVLSSYRGELNNE